MKPSLLITGGSTGVGKHIVDHFSPNSQSLSRSTGHDIGLAEGRRAIIEESLKHDIFINHAHNGHLVGQTQLLYELFEAWEKHAKPGYIFTTGSFATHIPPKDYKRYAVIKRSLEIAHQQCCKKIENGLVPFRMTLLTPGMLESEKEKSTQWQGHRLQGQEIAPLIEYLYNTPRTLLFNEVVLTGIQQRANSL